MHNHNERTQHAMLEWLHDQVNKGFDPHWMISLHYSHPSELLWQKRETKNELGWRERISFRSRNCLWKEVSTYNYWESYRNDWDQVDSDAKHIRNIILRVGCRCSLSCIPPQSFKLVFFTSNARHRQPTTHHLATELRKNKVECRYESSALEDLQSRCDRVYYDYFGFFTQ